MAAERMFDLPDELVKLLPLDPFEQLDVAHKITAIALSTRIKHLESESSDLRAKIADKDNLIADRDKRIADLEAQVESLAATLSQIADKDLVRIDQQKESLVKENASLSNTVKKLNRDVSKLGVFRRTLMQSLQEDEDNSGGALDIVAKVQSQLSLSSVSQIGDDDPSLPPSKSSSVQAYMPDTGNTFAEDQEYDAIRPRVPYSLLLASQTTTPRLTSPGSLHSCHKGVTLSDTEEVEPAKSCRTCDSVPSAEVKKVRESLKSSSLELQALVKDPLPDALQTSEVVRSKLAVKGINQNEDGDVDVPFQPNDANPVDQSFVHCSNNVRLPNLVERKATARTDECDDSLDNSPEVAQTRKKKRRWTSLEEDTLREGVKMFGEGSWQAIRGYYINIFENRSGVDLKDKWRNMTR